MFVRYRLTVYFRRKSDSLVFATPDTNQAVAIEILNKSIAENLAIVKMLFARNDIKIYDNSYAL